MKIEYDHLFVLSHNEFILFLFLKETGMSCFEDGPREKIVPQQGGEKFRIDYGSCLFNAVQGGIPERKYKP